MNKEKLLVYLQTARIFIKTCFLMVLHKIHLVYTIAKAFIQDPFDWRNKLLAEHPSFMLFMEARAEALKAGIYKDYVLSLLNTRLQQSEGKFILSGNNNINVESFDYDEERELIVFNKRPHLSCSLYFAEGVCGIKSRKQQDVQEALAYFGQIQTTQMKKPLAVASIVPYYAKTSNGKYDYVLINDKMIINAENLSKTIPGHSGGSNEETKQSN